MPENIFKSGLCALVSVCENVQESGLPAGTSISVVCEFWATCSADHGLAMPGVALSWVSTFSSVASRGFFAEPNFRFRKSFD